MKNHESDETPISKVCFGNSGKCVCGGKHIQYSDYTDPMCGIPLYLLEKEKENDER